MKLAMVSIVATLLAGCGTTERASVHTRPQPPAKGPPGTGTSFAPPPPAWVETRHGSRWLGYSSFCWGTTCADLVASRCGDGLTPDLRVRRNETVRVHLGFDPTELGLTFSTINGPGRQQRVEVSRTPVVRIERSGVFFLFARAKRGDASYVACALFTESGSGS